MRSVRELRVTSRTTVLVRAPLNVPLNSGAVANNFRIRRAVPTLKLLQEQGARIVVVSHLGELGTETLRPVADALGRLLPNVSFCEETVSPMARERVRVLTSGEILVLENLRRDRREKLNDPSFAAELAALGDAFVEDSFDACHRLHSSIVSVPKLLPSYAGLLVEEEVGELTRALTPHSPSLAIVGGAKFSTKEVVLERLLASYDHVFVGGALSNDFLKMRGEEVGHSLVSPTLDVPPEILRNPRLVLPIDSIVISESHRDDAEAHAFARIAPEGTINPDEIIWDHGPATVALLGKLINDAKSILWNGPVGNCERGFADATIGIARAIATSRAHSILGGGDTIAALEAHGLLSKFSFVSTGGGAMLEFLAHGSLPGIAVL